jgi:hypothetical protein
MVFRLGRPNLFNAVKPQPSDGVVHASYGWNGSPAFSIQYIAFSIFLAVAVVY